MFRFRCLGCWVVGLEFGLQGLERFGSGMLAKCSARSCEVGNELTTAFPDIAAWWTSSCPYMVVQMLMMARSGLNRHHEHVPQISARVITRVLCLRAEATSFNTEAQV